MTDGPGEPPEPPIYRRRLVILLTTIVVVVVLVAVASADRRIDVSADELLRPLAEVSPVLPAPPSGRLRFLAVDVIVASGHSYDLDDDCEWHGNQLPLTSETMTARRTTVSRKSAVTRFPAWRVSRYQVVTRNALVHSRVRSWTSSNVSHRVAGGSQMPDLPGVQGIERHQP